jgi:hypothetical protein
MSTSANINIKTKGVNSETLVRIYKHWDGYPTNLVKKLREICKNQTFINTLEHFAATLIAEIKKCSENTHGDIYILSPNSEEKEWNYDLYLNENKKLMIKIKGWGEEQSYLLNNLSDKDLLRIEYAHDEDIDFEEEGVQV